jgi:hypothetical protein
MNSERWTFLLFFLVIAGAAVILYLALGGDKTLQTSRTDLPMDETISEYTIDEEPVSTRRTSRGNFADRVGLTASAASHFSGIGSMSSGSGGSYDDVEPISNGTKSSKWSDKVLSWSKRTKVSMERRKSNFIRRLQAKGFKNDEYIQMMLQDEFNKDRERAIEQINNLLLRNEPTRALSTVDDALLNLPSSDHLGRVKLLHIKAQIGNIMKDKDLARQTTEQYLNALTKVTEIKMNTRLMDDATSSDKLKNQMDLITTNRESLLTSFDYFWDEWSQNGGMSMEMSRTMKAGLLNMQNQNPNIPLGQQDISSKFKKIEDQMQNFWKADKP